ncbi:MAG: TIGR02147 family protein [Bdellovibrionaceae bacterium]|jgi:uncharacterized protein (TIGR02147 family)|nr:TIGR02147 family protein [Pseudobdellovibrionaceae bacterium]
MENAKHIEEVRPNIFDYYDYREFLRLWLDYLKSKNKKLSLRKLGMSSGLSAWYLPKVLSGERELSLKAIEMLGPHLQLNKNEYSFLKQLRNLSDSYTQKERQEAFEKIRRFTDFRSVNAKSLDSYKYLSAWYYVAIREMAQLPDFQLDPKWIRKKLKYKISPTEARDALNFLLGNGYLELDENGKVISPEKPIVCDGGMYRLAMSSFIEQMLQLGVQSIFDTKREQRNHGLYTLSLSHKKFKKVQDILFSTLGAIQKISEEASGDPSDTVYQVSLLAFPLTKSEKS